MHTLSLQTSILTRRRLPLRVSDLILANMSTIRLQNWSLRRSISCNYLLILLFALSIAQCKAQIPYQPLTPSFDNKTYTHGDQFGRNLNKVLDDLVLNTPTTGVNVSSYGVSPNKVYGLLQCRGDASQKECYDCCQNVRNNVTFGCQNHVECRMWLLMCELYYRNDSSSIASPSTGTGVLVSVIDQFMKGQEIPFRNLVSNLSIGASTSIKRFAAGPSVDSSGHNIYALVQCYKVISISSCSNCLANATKQLQTYPYDYSAIYMDSCYVLLSNQSLSATNQSGKLPMNLGIGRAMLLLILLLWLLM